MGLAGQMRIKRIPLLLGFLFFVGTAQANSSFTAQVSQYGDDWLGTLFGSVTMTEISDTADLNFELDTSGYLSLGGSYGWIFSKSYIEPSVTYGRGDFFDLVDLSVFAVYMLTEKFTLYGNLGHQWREANSFPLIGGKGVFDQTELMTGIGVGYAALKKLDVDLSLHYNRLLSGNSGITEVENPDINYQSITITYKPKYVHPFVRFTHGKHRVSPGDPVLTDGSFEVGVRARF